MRAAVVALAAVLVVLALPLAAHAYVPSRTDKGIAVKWPGSCAFILPDQSASRDLTLDLVKQILDKSINNWQTPTLGAGCSYLEIHQDPPQDLDAHYDHVNVLKFRDDKWCRPAEPNHDEVCYSAAAAAITTIFYQSDGSIVDADIQMNELNFTFVWLPSNQPVHDGTTEADVENTLTHELGHFQGLDHTCWDHATADDPLDNTGMPIPDCNDLNDATKVSPAERNKIITATMFNFAAPGETLKRSPEADDIQGICDTYPKASDPGKCQRPEPVSNGGGCSIGGRPAWLGLFVLAMALVLLAFRRRS